jgi:mannose-6-phosphate isomerase-like protein (cupin superfamily)
MLKGNEKKMNKPYITMEEVIRSQGENGRTYRFLTEENGCVNGCASGTTVYADCEFSDRPGVHKDQEGFYVLEGEGYAKLDDLEFPIKAGDSFIALPGVAHTIKTKQGCQPVKVFWFHSGL